MTRITRHNAILTRVTSEWRATWGRISVAAAACLAAAPTTHAALLDRGGGLIYDSDSNITWLQDANYAQSSGFHPTGRLNWYAAMSWAAGLQYRDTVRNVTWTGWRLPHARETESVAPCYGFTCATSEVGHLYHVDGIKYGSPGPFINIKPSAYWTDTGRAPFPGHAWTFAFGFSAGDGIQDYTGALEDMLVAFAWAVHDGDIANVPADTAPPASPSTGTSKPSTAMPPTTAATIPAATSSDGGGAWSIWFSFLWLLRNLRVTDAVYTATRRLIAVAGLPR